jgi:outer membrane protein insertion porin family
MQFSRARSLRAGIYGLLAALPLLSQQQPAPQQPKPPNPFEQVPQADEAKPQPAKPEPAKPLTPGNPDRPPTDIIESINFRGARKVPQDTLRAMIFSKRGDPYDADSLHRDLITLWNTARFDNIELTREPGQTGWIVTFVVVERPVVRTIKYDGLKSITQSEVLDRFKERRVGLTPERPQQSSARPSGPAGLSGRARAPVRDRHAGAATVSAFFAEYSIQGG